LNQVHIPTSLGDEYCVRKYAQSVQCGDVYGHNNM